MPSPSNGEIYSPRFDPWRFMAHRATRSAWSVDSLERWSVGVKEWRSKNSIRANLIKTCCATLCESCTTRAAMQTAPLSAQHNILMPPIRTRRVTRGNDATGSSLPPLVQLVPWRTLATAASTAALLALCGISVETRNVVRFVWLLVFALWFSYLLYKMGSIVVDIYDNGQSNEISGLSGVATAIDVWTAREITLGNLWFLVFLFSHGDYGALMRGLEIYTIDSSVWTVYPHVLSFSFFTSISTGSDYATPEAAWLRIIGLLSALISFLVINLVIVICLTESVVQLRLKKGAE